MPGLLKTIHDALAGDAESIGVLLQRFGGAVEYECRRYFIEHQIEWALDDLEQEVSLRVWTRLHSFQGGHQEDNLAIVFEGWIRRTARSMIDNVVRRSRMQRRSLGSDLLQRDDACQPPSQPHCAGGSPCSNASEIAESTRINEALSERLDHQSRRIVELHFGEGYSLEQIGQRLALSRDQVRNVFQAAIDELHKQMK